MKKPVFHENLDDSLHCSQACFKMALESKPPFTKLSFEQVDILTGFIPDKLTWPMKAYVAAFELGYAVEIYDPMDFVRFRDNPHLYMKEAFGEEAAKLYYQETDIPSAVKDTEALISSGIRVNSDVPSRRDLTLLIDSGFLCICHVDHGILINSATQDDHVVLVYGYDSQYVRFHDPGPPSGKGVSVTWDVFEAAWSSPSESAKTIFAIG